MRSKPRLFTLLTTLSLAFSLGSAMLGYVSYSRTDWFIWSGSDADWFVANMRGQFRIARTSPISESVKQDRASWQHEGLEHRVDPSALLERVPGETLYGWLQGLAFATGERWQDYHYELMVPHWLLVTLFLVLPSYAFLRRRKHHFRPAFEIVTNGF